MVSAANLTRALEKFARERLDIDLLGIAPAERLEGAPDGKTSHGLPA